MRQARRAHHGPGRASDTAGRGLRAPPCHRVGAELPLLPLRCYPRLLLGEPSVSATRHLLDPPSLSLRRQRRPSKLSSLSRSLSRRLGSGGGLFWRRRGEDEDAAAAAAAPSGSGSEPGASSAETATSDGSASAGRRGSRCESDSDLSTAATSAGDEQHEVVNYYYCCLVATAIIMHACRLQ